jgi:hypothetical protein
MDVIIRKVYGIIPIALGTCLRQNRRRPMFTAYDVYKSAIGEDQYAFAIGKERLLKELRAFADAIEKEEILFQSIEMSTIAEHDEFGYSLMKLKFIEKQKWIEQARAAKKEV